jgi:hypothetical protein
MFSVVAGAAETLLTLFIRKKFGSIMLDRHLPRFFSVPTDECWKIGHNRDFPHPFSSPKQLFIFLLFTLRIFHVSHLATAPASKYSSQKLVFQKFILWMYYSTPYLTAYLSPFCLHGLSIC